MSQNCVNCTKKSIETFFGRKMKKMKKQEKSIGCIVNRGRLKKTEFVSSNLYYNEDDWQKGRKCSIGKKIYIQNIEKEV